MKRRKFVKGVFGRFERQPQVKLQYEPSERERQEMLDLTPETRELFDALQKAMDTTIKTFREKFEAAHGDTDETHYKWKWLQAQATLNALVGVLARWTMVWAGEEMMAVQFMCDSKGELREDLPEPDSPEGEAIVKRIMAESSARMDAMIARQDAFQKALTKCLGDFLRQFPPDKRFTPPQPTLGLN